MEEAISSGHSRFNQFKSTIKIPDHYLGDTRLKINEDEVQYF
jgi:hypothetical protein